MIKRVESQQIVLDNQAETLGDAETLLDDSVRFAKKAEEAGVEVHLHMWDGLFHCFSLLALMFREATQAMDEVCAFVHKQLA